MIKLENDMCYEYIYLESSTQKILIGPKYGTELSHNSGTVTATVKDFLGNVATDFVTPIVFEYDGTTVTANPVNGVASITFTSTVAGPHTVRTANADIRNGEVTFNA